MPIIYLGITHVMFGSVGGGFVVNEKTKVDENLFYKGVDKSSVHGARLHQTHSLTEPDNNRTEEAADPCSPPYPFVVRLSVDLSLVNCLTPLSPEIVYLLLPRSITYVVPDLSDLFLIVCTLENHRANCLRQ